MVLDSAGWCGKGEMEKRRRRGGVEEESEVRGRANTSSSQPHKPPEEHTKRVEEALQVAGEQAFQAGFSLQNALKMQPFLPKAD